jgi:hypothetical protein
VKLPDRLPLEIVTVEIVGRVIDRARRRLAPAVPSALVDAMCHGRGPEEVTS